MPILDCTFTSGGKQVTHKSEAASAALYNAQIATHTTMGADRATPKTREQAKEQNIEADDPLVNWEFIRPAVKSSNTSTNMGCLDNDLQELPYKKDKEP